MSKIAVSDQKYINSGLYLDAKMQPVANLDALYAIPMQQRFKGLEVVVLSDPNGKMAKYWLEGGTKNSNWTKKTYGNATYTEGEGIKISGSTISIDETVITNDKLIELIETTGSSINQKIIEVVNGAVGDGKLTIKSGEDVLCEFNANQKDDVELQLWDEFKQ